MTASTLKQLLVVGILFATFSLSVSLIEEAEITPENIQRILKHKNRDPRAFNYIKTPEGRRQPVSLVSLYSEAQSCVSQCFTSHILSGHCFLFRRDKMKSMR